MSERELKPLEVLSPVQHDRLSQVSAAVQLSLTERQIRRLLPHTDASPSL